MSVPNTSTQVEEPPPRPRRAHAARDRNRGAFVEIPVLVVIAIVVALVLKTFVGQAFYIPSASMEPQLHIDDRVVVSKVAYDLHEPRRGDIAVFPSPVAEPDDDDAVPVRLFHSLLEAFGLREPAHEVLIKRVIGLPGETVEGRDGHVFINGSQLNEPYLPAGVRTGSFGPVTVPEDHVWMMGDNRPNSRDSRVFGPIASSELIGRAFAKVWPPGSVSFL